MSLPAQSKPLLPHYPAFEELFATDADSLQKLVALGIYVQAECLWARDLSGHPTSGQISSFHNAMSTTHRLNEVRERAGQELQRFSKDLIDLHQSNFLNGLIRDVTESVHKAPKSFWRGVSEAFVGALFWTLALIVASIILRYGGIDLLEVYKRVGG